VRGAPITLAGLARQWARCLAPAGTVPEQTVDLQYADVPVSDEMGLRLTWRVNVAGIDSRSGRALMFHAAGLSRPDGSVLGLVAPSGTGKTTAALTLARAGYGYVTDETLTIDPVSLAVEPFAKPLSVIDPDHHEKQLVGPDDLGLATCPAQLGLHRLVALDRRPGPHPPRLRTADLEEALPLLVAESSAIARMPRALRRIEALLAAVGGLHVLEYAEIADALPLLDTLMAGPPPVVPPVVAGSEDDSTRTLGEPAAPRDPGEPAYAVVEVVDVLRYDAGLFVLAGEQLTQLTALGEVVWEAAQAGATLDRLHDAAVAAVGPDPHSRELVEQAVEAMLDQGLLRRLA